jgi:CheY-like chemotaxis protein
MADDAPRILAVADLAYSGGDVAELLKLTLHRYLQIDLQIVPLAEVTTTMKQLKPQLLIIGHRPLLEDDAMRERWRMAGSPMGSDIVRALKSDPESKDIPILMLESLIDLKKIAEECGADSYVTVPFGPQELVDAIKPWIAADKHP